MPPVGRGPAERDAEIGPADIADKQRVTGEDGVGSVPLRSRSKTRMEIDSGVCPGVSSACSRARRADAIAVSERHERIFRFGRGAEIDRGADAIPSSR
jgi:hypothetical protein